MNEFPADKARMTTRKMRSTKPAHERAHVGLETTRTLSTSPSLAITITSHSHPHHDLCSPSFHIRTLILSTRRHPHILTMKTFLTPYSQQISFFFHFKFLSAKKNLSVKSTCRQNNLSAKRRGQNDCRQSDCRQYDCDPFFRCRQRIQK
jgi:hypothetical protein